MFQYKTPNANPTQAKDFSRRALLSCSMVATAGCLAPITAAKVVGGWQAPEPRSASKIIPPQTPAEALKMLYEGNRRFANGQSLASNRDIARVREVSKQQKPFAAFLGCADSRVPIEIVFDQGFGDLFVTRIAGNIAASENIGSLEFGTHVLGAKVIFVLGHTQCGAVQATMQGVEVPGQISGLFQHIRPAVKAANGDLDQAIIANVRNQAILLAEASPVISKMVRRNELIVAGGIYDLATGQVTAVSVPLS
jgi:carbonic anhydrase